MAAVAEAEHALLGAAFLLVAPGAAERGVEAVLVERLLEPFGLPQVGVQRAVVERVDPLRLGVRVLVDDELDARLGGDRVAQRVHVPELPAGVDVEQRERQRRREEGLLRQMQQHRRILAHRIEHAPAASASATVSRRMKMLSASSRSRWVSALHFACQR